MNKVKDSGKKLIVDPGHINGFLWDWENDYEGSKDLIYETDAETAATVHQLVEKMQQMRELILLQESQI